jgi:hypothetical protein
MKPTAKKIEKLIHRLDLRTLAIEGRKAGREGIGHDALPMT